MLLLIYRTEIRRKDESTGIPTIRNDSGILQDIERILRLMQSLRFT